MRINELRRERNKLHLVKNELLAARNKLCRARERIGPFLKRIRFAIKRKRQWSKALHLGYFAGREKLNGDSLHSLMLTRIVAFLISVYLADVSPIIRSDGRPSWAVSGMFQNVLRRILL